MRAAGSSAGAALAVLIATLGPRRGKWFVHFWTTIGTIPTFARRNSSFRQTARATSAGTTGAHPSCSSRIAANATAAPRVPAGRGNHVGKPGSPAHRKWQGCAAGACPNEEQDSERRRADPGPLPSLRQVVGGGHARGAAARQVLPLPRPRFWCSPQRRGQSFRFDPPRGSNRQWPPRIRQRLKARREASVRSVVRVKCVRCGEMFERTVTPSP